MVLALRFMLFLILVYPLCLILTFAYEFGYKKRQIEEIKRDFRDILKKANLIYLFFVAISLTYVYVKY